MRPATRELLRIDAEVRREQEDARARARALSEAYPLLKEAAELLELEDVEPLATRAKKLRQDVGALLAIEGSSTEFGP